MSFVGGPALLNAGSPYPVADTFTAPGPLGERLGEAGTPWLGGADDYVVVSGAVQPVDGVGSPTYSTASGIFNGYVQIKTEHNQHYLHSGALLQTHFEGAVGSTSIVDSSLANTNLTCYNTAKLASTSRFGWSSLLVGTASASVDRAHVRTLSYGIPIEGEFCFEMYIHPLDDRIGAIAAINDLSATNPSAFIIMRESAQQEISVIYGQLRSDSVVTTSTRTVIITASLDGGRVGAGRWSHIALTRDGTGIKLWVNGLAVGSWASTAQGRNWQDAFTLGELWFGRPHSATSSRYFYGYIDEARFVLADAVYRQPFIPPQRPHSDATT